MEKSNDIIAELNEKNLQFSNKIKESKDLVEKLEQKILKIQK